MVCRWFIDECSWTRVAGWIDDNGPVKAIEIAVNGRRVATLSPTDYRRDLEQAGLGDGRRAFEFALSRFLVAPVNQVSITRGDQLLHSAAVSLPIGSSPVGRTGVPDRLAAVSPAANIATARRDRGNQREPMLTGGVRRVYREVTSIEDCDFYHVVDLPDGTTTRGQWDLRTTADEYLGNVEFSGKRVLEIGPASGFLSFHMEACGARVAVIEPPMESFWDLVPYAAVNLDEVRATFASHVERIRNSFWYLHRLRNSNVESYEVDAYQIPVQPRKFDMAVLASVLLHTSSPVRLLASAAALVTDQIVIVERYFEGLADRPVCRLVPTEAKRSLETWWEFSPKFFEQYLGVLGFRQIGMTRHRQFFATINQEWELFTIVGARS
jgi:hypothetical protein